MISLIDILDEGFCEAEERAMEARHREMDKKIERLNERAEALHCEANDLEDQASRLELAMKKEREHKQDGVGTVADWMLRNLAVSPLAEARLQYAIEHSDARVVLAVGVLYQVPLPMAFYPAVPDRARVARGSCKDLPLFAGRIEG